VRGIRSFTAGGRMFAQAPLRREPGEDEHGIRGHGAQVTCCWPGAIDQESPPFSVVVEADCATGVVWTRCGHPVGTNFVLLDRGAPWCIQYLRDPSRFRRRSPTRSLRSHPNRRRRDAPSRRGHHRDRPSHRRRADRVGYLQLPASVAQRAQGDGHDQVLTCSYRAVLRQLGYCRRTGWPSMSGRTSQGPPVDRRLDGGHGARLD
jgi:hypothetical protein